MQSNFCVCIISYGNTPFAPLAQLAEQVTLNHWVAGSIPARCIFRSGDFRHARRRRREAAALLINILLRDGHFAADAEGAAGDF